MSQLDCARQALVEALANSVENAETKSKKSRRGLPVGRQGGERLSARNDDGVYDYAKPFAEQIDDWQEGRIPRNDSLIVGPTPEVFKKIGFNALPVTINQTHVAYAVNGKRDLDHYLGAEMLKQLPTALEKPLAIVRSQSKNGKGEQMNRVVAILELTHNNTPVIAAIEIDGYGTQNNTTIDSNAVTSVFAKKNAITKLFYDAVQEEENGEIGVYYLDTEKAPVLFQTPGVQFPGHLLRNGGYVHSIAEPSSLVKLKLKNVTQSQQFKRWFGDWENDPYMASKVVNEDGTPKVVYHGTNSDFYTFDTERQGKTQRQKRENRQNLCLGEPWIHAPALRGKRG